MDTLIFRSTAVIGVTVPFYLSGYGISASHLTLPPLYEIPQKQALKVFKYVFQSGKPVFISLAVLSILSSTTASYLSAAAATGAGAGAGNASSLLSTFISGGPATGYALSALLTLSTLPLTQIFMMSGITTLVQCEEDERVREKIGEQGVARLLKSWQSWNVLRASFLLASGVVGAVTLAS